MILFPEEVLSLVHPWKLSFSDFISVNCSEIRWIQLMTNLLSGTYTFFEFWDKRHKTLSSIYLDFSSTHISFFKVAEATFKCAFSQHTPSSPLIEHSSAQNAGFERWGKRYLLVIGLYNHTVWILLTVRRAFLTLQLSMRSDGSCVAWGREVTGNSTWIPG